VQCFSMTMHIHIQVLILLLHRAFQLGAVWPPSFTALISLWATTTNLPAWRTGWDHSASTIMSWWNVLEHCWAHMWQTSLTHAYKTYLPIQVP
jgi:hypothetical protein